MPHLCTAQHALELIENGNALIKVITANAADVGNGTQDWGFYLGQLVNPADSSKRAYRRGSWQSYKQDTRTRAWDPRTGQYGRCDTREGLIQLIKEGFLRPSDYAAADLDYAPTHMAMTATSLLPPDGKMSFFQNDDVIGLLMDINLCDVMGERYVFKNNAITNENWWKEDADTTYRTRSTTIDTIRAQHRNARHIPPSHNEILACINRDAITGVFCLSESLNDRMNALHKSFRICDELDIDVPVLIIDRTHGAREYTLADQLDDVFEVVTQIESDGYSTYDQNGAAFLQAIVPNENSRDAFFDRILMRIAQRNQADRESLSDYLLSKDDAYRMFSEKQIHLLTNKFNFPAMICDAISNNNAAAVEETVRYVRSFNLDIELFNPDSTPSPLHTAIARKNCAMLHSMLGDSVDPTTYADGMNALDAAIHSGAGPEIIAILLPYFEQTPDLILESFAKPGLQNMIIVHLNNFRDPNNEASASEAYDVLNQIFGEAIVQDVVQQFIEHNTVPSPYDQLFAFACTYNLPELLEVAIANNCQPLGLLHIIQNVMAQGHDAIIDTLLPTINQINNAQLATIVKQLNYQNGSHAALRLAIIQRLTKRAPQAPLLASAGCHYALHTNNPALLRDMLRHDGSLNTPLAEMQQLAQQGANTLLTILVNHGAHLAIDDRLPLIIAACQHQAIERDVINAMMQLEGHGCDKTQYVDIAHSLYARIETLDTEIVSAMLSSSVAVKQAKVDKLTTLVETILQVSTTATSSQIALLTVLAHIEAAQRDTDLNQTWLFKSRTTSLLESIDANLSAQRDGDILTHTGTLAATP